MEPLIMSISRTNTSVRINIDSNLDVGKRIIPFSFSFENELVAELVRRHLQELLLSWQQEIAKKPWHYIWGEDLNKVKRYLVKKWDSRKMQFK